MARTDEASTTVILYLSPHPHHLPSISSIQGTNSDNEMSVQLSEELSSCNALPDSSEPVNSYVVSPMTSDNWQCADGDVIVEKQLDVTTGCVDSVTEHCSSHSQVDALTQNVLTTEDTALHFQNVGHCKVSDIKLLLLDSRQLACVCLNHINLTFPVLQ